MAWFQTVQKFFSRKSDPTYQAYTQFLGVGSPIYTPRNFTSLAKEGYEKNITVYRSVSLIAQSCAGIPWKLYRTGSVKNKEITSHPLLDLLANPNPQNGTASFIEDIVSFWLIAGNSYVICVRPRPGASPRELWVLRPDRITIVPGSFNIAGFDYSLDGHRQFFLAEDMLHLKMFAANNDWYGLSPVSVAAALIDQQNEGFDWNTAILQNMGRPSGALVATGVLGNDQYERLKKLIRERYTGKKNAGTPMLLEGGLDWKQFSMSPLELDWMESRKQNMRDISIALGVPPELLGDSANKTYSNYQEARKSFYQETILPLMDKLRDRLNVWLVPMFEEGIELRYDKEEVEALQEDRESLSSRLIAQWNAGLVTLNEVRDQLGLSELNGGDILQTLVQGHVYIPSDQLQQYVEAKLENLMAPPAPPAPGQPAPDLHLPDNGTGPEENNPTNAVLTANQPARPKPPAGQSGSNPEQANPARTGVPGASEDDEAGSPFEMSYGAPPPGERKAAQDVAEGLFQSALAAYFREEEQALHATLLRGALPETILPRIKALLDKREPLLEEVLKDQYRLLGKQRAVEIWKQLQQERKAAKKPAKKPDDLVGDALQAWLDTHPVDLASDGDVYTLMDSNFDPSQDMYWNAATEKYFQQFAFKRVQSIQQNTFSLLKKEIDEGLVHKETLPQIMVRIEVLYKEGFIPIRSKTIAQTELTSAFNFGGRVAAISAGIPLDKQWVAQADAKVRPAHKQAHGQTTDLYEPYVVNGEQLMYPGDVSMNASAENTINCRCSETYSAKKEKSSKPFEIPVFSRQDEPESLFIRQQVYPIKRKKARSESRLTRDFKAMREMVEKKRK